MGRSRRPAATTLPARRRLRTAITPSRVMDASARGGRCLTPVTGAADRSCHRSAASPRRPRPSTPPGNSSAWTARRRSPGVRPAIASPAPASPTAIRDSSRDTVAASSPRRTRRERLEFVIRQRRASRLSRTTGVIHGCAQLSRRSVTITCCGLARASSGSRRTPTSAAMCARVSDDSPGMARYSSGSFARATLARKRAMASGRKIGGLDRRRPFVRGQRAEIVALLFEDLADRREGFGIGGIQLRRRGDSDRGRRPTDQPAARRWRDRDRETPIRATRQSPVDRPPFASSHRRASAAALARASISCVARKRSTPTRLRRSVSDGSSARAASKLASASPGRSSSSSACPRPTSAGTYRGSAARARSKRVAASFSLPRASAT